MNYVDLHLHLLPEIDDGSKSMAETLEMAKALISLGFSQAAPSPHNRPEYQPRQVCVERLETVQQALDAQGLTLKLHVNSENFFLDPNLLAHLPTPESRRIGAAGRYLLVEAPYTSPLPSLNDIIFRMKVKGVTPVIAHPERCIEFEKKGRAAELVNAGALLQLDIGALIGRYGKTAQKLAKQFCDEDLYAIAASDLHSPVGAAQWVGESIVALKKGWGEARVAKLLAQNPSAILEGREVV